MLTAFFRDREVLGDVESGEKLERLMKFARLHGVQLESIPPSWGSSNCLCCFFVVSWYFSLKA